MRVTNIDTFSAYLDRLVTEEIKMFFFKKDKNIKKVKHQEKIISEIISKISRLLKEPGEYSYLSELRTFDENSIVEKLQELIYNNVNIGEADRERLAEATSPSPNLQKMVINEKRLRKANEGRARVKNELDSWFYNFKKFFIRG